MVHECLPDALLSSPNFHVQVRIAVISGLILGALLRIRGHYMVVEPQPAPNP